MNIKKAISRTVMVLACAAALTSVAAQYPWETPGNVETGSADAGEEAAAAPAEASPYDIGTYSQPEAAEPSASEPPAAEAPAARASEPVRARPGYVPSFSGPQKTCPVCASIRLKDNLYVEHSGKKVHVCSAACIGRVRRNPAPFIAKLEKRGEQLAGQ